MFQLRASWRSLALRACRFQSTAALPNPVNSKLFASDAAESDLELKDKTYKRQRKLAIGNIKMKFYANGHLQPGSTHFKKPIHEHLHRGGPVRELTVAKKKTAGRNATGKITVRGRGGGHRRRVRLVDNNRLVSGRQKVLRIEYDPNRSGHIALLQHEETGNLSYILACSGLRAGDFVESFRQGLPQDFLNEMERTNHGAIDDALLNSRLLQRGNCVPLRMLPPGSIIHNIGLTPGGPGRMVRAAGTFARLLSKNPAKKQVTISLGSGEHRYVHENCHATLGMVSNPEHSAISWGKAGRSRHRGFRPQTRGVAMNAKDHPHGGGRGKSKSNKLTQSAWGLKKFVKTRKGKNINKMKIKDRERRPPKK